VGKYRFCSPGWGGGGGGYLGVGEPCHQVLHEVVAGGLAEAPDPVARLLKVVPQDVVLATAVVGPLPAAVDHLPRSRRLSVTF